MRNGIPSWIAVALFAAYAIAGESPKYGPQATRLVRSTEYVRKNPAPDFWNLISYYVPQQDGRSCSLASVTMIVNAARASKDLRASDALITQKGLLDGLKHPIWKRGLRAMGQGVTLDELAVVAGESLKAHGFPQAKVEVLRVDEKPETAKRVREVLMENEGSEIDFVLVNYLQSELTGDPEGKVGHIAPLAAFDAKTRRALILDPDREYYEPYWVSEEQLIRSMATRDSVSGKTRGLIHIKLGS
jgi:hypothetical protein